MFHPFPVVLESKETILEQPEGFLGVFPTRELWVGVPTGEAGTAQGWLSQDPPQMGSLSRSLLTPRPPHPAVHGTLAPAGDGGESHVHGGRGNPCRPCCLQRWVRGKGRWHRAGQGHAAPHRKTWRTASLGAGSFIYSCFSVQLRYCCPPHLFP